ncbi:MAG: gliding motility-associated C-terminal domain-containing protein [Flavobacteriales bacterium]|nr:gliding motility-associated C-terminal domain-containing protein [Flavobacteriales bacterium]
MGPRILTLIVFVLGSHVCTRAQCSGMTMKTNTSSVCAPGTIQFTIENLPPSSSVIWNVGKGSINGRDTFHEFYLDPIKIAPYAVITFPDGRKCTLNGPAAEVLGKPEPLMKVSRTKLCAGPDTITLTNLTPNTKQLSWVIDGTNYFNGDISQIHRFKTSGLKSLSMVVIDSFGCRGIREYKDVVIVHPNIEVELIADKRSGCIPQRVAIQPRIQDFGEKITSYTWYFEGATDPLSNDPTPDTLIYGKAGVFDTRLEMITANSCTLQFTKSDWLRFGDTLPLHLQISDTLLCKGDVITVGLPDKPTNMPEWIYPGALVVRSDTQSISLKYQSAGRFDLGIRYSNNQCPSSAFKSGIIRVREVKANFNSTDHFHCKIPHVVHMENRSTASEKGPMLITWKYFDKGKLVRLANGNSDSIVLPDWRKLDVELIARHMNGCVDTFRIPNYIRVDKIRPQLRVTPAVACKGQMVMIESITPPSSYLAPDTFNWTLFDRDTVSILYTDNKKRFYYSYSDTGKYHIQLHAANAIGCRDSILRLNAVEIVEPKLSFAMSDSILCAGSTVRMKGTTEPKRANFRHFWNVHHMSDSAESIEVEGADAQFELNKPGSWSVMYRHQILEGCRDSVRFPDTLKVNGIDLQIIPDTVSGCLPFIVQPECSIVYNYHFGTDRKDVLFRWFTEPMAGVEIDDPSKPRPTFTFTRRGMYRIGLEVTNSMGCKKVKYSEPIYAGVQAGLELSAESICINGEVAVLDRSALKPTSIEWIVDAGIGYETRRPDTFYIRPLERGNYRILQVAGKHGSCYDTAEATLNSVEVRVDFTLSDTQLYCAPAYVQFEAFAESADTFIWDFGDGTRIKTTDAAIANIYKRNTGWNAGFNISMIAKSKLGCSDTLTKVNGVKVLGPVPGFRMIQHRGCDPLLVSFENVSTDAVTFRLHYNDASPLDSVAETSHLYRIAVARDSQVFNPSLYAIDSFGCAAIYVPDDSVVVYRSPVAKMYHPDTLACIPERLYFSDLSEKVVRRRWLINSVEAGRDSTLKTENTLSGIDTLSLVVTNGHSCHDTAIVAIRKMENPQLEILAAPILCAGKPEIFTAINRRENGDLKWKWYFPNQRGALNASRNVFSPDRKGILSVRVVAEDQFGCASSLSAEFLVRDSTDIGAAPLKYVSYADNDHLELFWEPASDSFIATSVLFESSVNVEVSRQAANNTGYQKQFIPDRFTPPCFILRFEDRCGNLGIPGSAHCPVTLTLGSNAPYSIDLEWTAYRGWKKVDAYQIYRRCEGDTMKLLAVVDADVFQYRDTELCDESYTYTIFAVSGTLRSRSNTESLRPLYVHLDPQIDVIRASVVENSRIEVHWEGSKQGILEKYSVAMWKTGDSLPMEIIDTRDTIFEHEQALINETSYTYRILATDRCGIKGDAGFVGTSILLRGHYRQGSVELSWNPYREWPGGVKNYVVELKKGDAFVPIALLNGTEMAYSDADPHMDIPGSFTYRIRALGETNDRYFSLSNTVEVIGPSELYIPNAFSPNSDHLNDAFRPGTRFMDHLVRTGVGAYRMQIYNRWGEKLFECTELEKGWNGMYMGNKVPMGSYLYHIHVQGLDGVLYDVEGAVNVLY